MSTAVEKDAIRYGKKRTEWNETRGKNGQWERRTIGTFPFCVPSFCSLPNATWHHDFQRQPQQPAHRWAVIAGTPKVLLPFGVFASMKPITGVFCFHWKLKKKFCSSLVFKVSLLRYFSTVFLRRCACIKSISFW